MKHTNWLWNTPTGLGLACALILGAARIATAADFNIITPNDVYAFNINGVDGDPTITLVRGSSYTFAIDTSGIHPFAIGTELGGGPPPGVSGDNGANFGTITYDVPTDAVDCLYYCTFHLFSGNIHFVDPTPPPPPTVKIVGLTVGTNLLLTLQQSTTNGHSFIPEATTNLARTNWFALTVLSNRFANGTNEIYCGRPAGTNVQLRIRIN